MQKVTSYKDRYYHRNQLSCPQLSVISCKFQIHITRFNCVVHPVCFLVCSWAWNWHREVYILWLSSGSSRTGFKVLPGIESSGNQVRSVLGTIPAASGLLWWFSGAKACGKRRERSSSVARGRTSARTESALSGCVCALTRNTLRLALTGRRYIQRERPRSSARSMFFLLCSFARASPCPPFCLPFKSLAFYPSAGCSSQIYYFGRMMHREIRGFARHCQPSGSFTSALTSW